MEKNNSAIDTVPIAKYI